MKIREVYYLSIYPLTAVVCLIINIMILKNTRDEELMAMGLEEYMKEVMLKYKELFLDKYVVILDIMATLSWLMILQRQCL